jgi:tripartite-type tricarboxylate transporter receptor subunit TctC
MHLRNGMIAALASATAFGGGDAIAQTYPTRPVEIVVPFSPGAVTDVLGRALADGLSTNLGQRFIVVNKAGATGGIGSLAVARANPDGYSLLFTAAVSMTVLPLTNKQLGYDHKAFDPICQTFRNEMVVVVRPDSPFKSVRDLVEAAKAKPGGVSYGHLGVASIPHLAMIEFGQAAKVEFNAIPFKGDAEVLQQTLGGQVDFGSITLSSAAGGGLRILGLFASARNPALPEVPTIKEQGFDVVPSSFGGLSGPVGLPADVKRKLTDACQAAALGEAYARLAKTVFQPADYFADATTFAQRLDQDVVDKSRLIATLGSLQ